MARGRPRKNPEQKKEEVASQSAADATALFPESADDFKRIFEDHSGYVSEARKAAADVGAFKKQQLQKHGIDPVSFQIISKLLDLKQGRREGVVAQIKWAIEKLNMAPQLDLFVDGGAGKVEPDEGSVFDKTRSGKAVDTERRDDPAKATRAANVVPMPKKEPEPGLSTDEALTRFEDAKKAKEEKEQKRVATKQSALAKLQGKSRDDVQRTADKYLDRDGNPVKKSPLDGLPTTKH